MGCSSASLGSQSGRNSAATGPTAAYISAGSPCVVANLWDVTDRDIDLFTEDLLKRYAPCCPGNCSRWNDVLALEHTRSQTVAHVCRCITSIAHSHACSARQPPARVGTPQKLHDAATALAQLDLNAHRIGATRDRACAQLPEGIGVKRRTGRGGRLHRLAEQAAVRDAGAAYARQTTVCSSLHFV